MELVFHVSDVRVEVQCELAAVARGLGAVWRSCGAALMPASRVARFSVHREDAGFVIAGPDGQQPCERSEDVLPVLEALLYGAMSAWHARWVLLHAACLRVHCQPLLVLAPSGGGKSSLALAALRAGHEYLGDELAVTDGARVWGVPRAVQFSPCLDAGELPPWARDADVTSYRLRLQGERMGAVPLYAPPAEQVATAPFPVEGLRLIAVQRGEPRGLQALTGVEALGVLHEACFAPPGLDLGGLVHPGRAARLGWDVPEAAIEALASWVRQS